MSPTIDGIRATGFISADHVLALRREFYADGAISSVEADQLWKLYHTVPKGDPTWSDFFIEALADHFVQGCHPKGYLDDAQAEQLISKISFDGAVQSRLGFELLIKLIEQARSVPNSLITFAYKSIRQMVLQGHGPTRLGQAEAGVITKSDVAYLRRLIFAASSEDHHGISHLEAELLFDLNDATIDAKNTPEWSDLFTKAIANFLMAHIGYKPPSREESLRRSAWLDDANVGVGNFLANMATSGFSGFKALFDTSDIRDQETQKTDLAIIEAERINKYESAWLAERIGRDNVLHENEIALINYMQTLGADLPECLRARIDMIRAG